MPFLDVEQKKGDPLLLDGRLTAYARVDIEPADIINLKHPVSSMVHNGLLAAQGNFREQSNLRDFLKNEMGLSLEEGLEQLLDKLDGLESALDPAKLKDKIEHMDDMEDFIPTPAKIVPFHSEEEILAQDGDVFFTGIFKNIGNAILSVNAFPILYQARYREQVHENVRQEIDTIISQIEQNGQPTDHYTTPGVNVDQKILKEYIPNMLYCRKDKKVFETAENQLRTFMTGYAFKEDIDAIVNTIKNPGELTSRHYKILELYARKISEINKEHFTEAEAIKSAIRELEQKQNG